MLLGEVFTVGIPGQLRVSQCVHQPGREETTLIVSEALASGQAKGSVHIA